MRAIRYSDTVQMEDGEDFEDGLNAAFEAGKARALLERDVADVEWHLRECMEGAAHWDESAAEVYSEGPSEPTPLDIKQMDETILFLRGLAQGFRDRETDCRAWLARARAVLS